MKHLILNNQLFEHWLNEYQKILLVKGIGNGKCPMYVSHVREFLHFLEKKKINDFKAIKNTVILEYYQYILNRPNQRLGGHLSQNSVQHQIQGIRSFFDFLLDSKLIFQNPVRVVKFKFKPSQPRQILTVEEIRALFRRKISPMMKALLCCAYGCGLRRNEIHQLNLNEVNLKDGHILVRNGKGGKARLVPLSSKICHYLKIYVTSKADIWVFEDNLIAPFFVNKIGKRMSGNSLNQHLKKIVMNSSLSELKLKNITLHCMRNSIAVHLIENGAQIEFVRDFLGHNDIDTSQLYAIRRRRSNSIYKAFRF
jgi:site-specific recombinase XerD